VSDKNKLITNHDDNAINATTTHSHITSVSKVLVCIDVLLGVLGSDAAPPGCWRNWKFLGCQKFLGVGQKFSYDISIKTHLSYEHVAFWALYIVQ